MESYRHRPETHVPAAFPSPEPEPPIETPPEIEAMMEFLSNYLLEEAEAEEEEEMDHEVRELLSDYLSEAEAEWQMYLMRAEHANLWREAEAPEMGRRFSSTPWETDEESARSWGKRYEEMVLQQLKIRNIDQKEERHEDEEEEICSVCLGDLYRGTVAALDCRHEFHVDCIKRWLVGGKNFCPLCRATALPLEEIL